MPIKTRQHYWVLETQNSAYTLGINDADLLVHSYHGQRLPIIDDYPSPVSSNDYSSFSHAAHRTPEEYPAIEGIKFIEPCIKAVFADGVRDLRLRYIDDAITGDTLQIRLVDEQYGLSVTLYYRVHTNYDLIERWATVDNQGSAAVDLERVWSAQWHFPSGQQYQLHHLWGKWFDEWHHAMETLQSGVKVLESRRITSSHEHHPYFAVNIAESDEVWFGVLAWSGNWKLAAEVTEFHQTRISIGVNDWDFRWQLGAGGQFKTPSAFCGYTTDGHEAAAHLLHDFVREQVVPHPQQERLVLYNSWEATLFDIDIEQQKAFANKAAAIGVELFVMDDGWFAGRKDDTAGLGDWYPEPSRFPEGLSPLIEHVHGLGMKFGLWLEPEMTNADSNLYREHPDWVIHFPNRSRTEGRNQLILNMALSDVQDYLIALLDELLSNNAIDFIKWDMNRHVSEAGFVQAQGDQRELWVRYVHGMYRLWDSLRERHPQIIWQSCSGGGGRADLGMLSRADQIWLSDNTIPARRLDMQAAFLRAYPASVMEAWVTDMGDDFVPLSFRFHVSMCGVLGVGANLEHWNAKDMKEATKWIALYKEIREMVQFGDLYQLTVTQAGYYALQYVSKDQQEAVIFVFRTHVPDPAPPFVFHLRGLQPDARYRHQSTGETKSGAAWMAIQQEAALGNFRSEIWRLKQV